MRQVLYLTFIITLFVFNLPLAMSKQKTLSDIEQVFGKFQLGKGYVSYDQAVTSAIAIENAEVFRGNPTGSISFSLSESLTDFKRQLGIYASVSVPVKFINVKSISDFVHSYTENDQTISLIYSANWAYRYQLIPKNNRGHFIISNEAKSLWQLSPETFLAAYGNRYISGLNAGASLYMLVQIHFDSEEAKIQFQQAVGLSKKDIIDILLELKGEIKTKHLTGDVYIQALQLGGDPSQLSNVFSSSTDDGSAFSVFNFDDIDYGLNIVNEAVDYVNDLKKQVDPDNPDDLFVFGDIQTESYHSLDPMIDAYPYGMLDKNALSARKTLEDAYKLLEYIQSQTLPIYIYNNYYNYLSNNAQYVLSGVLKYKDDLVDYFENIQDSAQYYCYQPGTENAYCPIAQQRLNEITPEGIGQLIDQLQQFNYSVNISDQYVAYPTSILFNDGDLLKQLFVIEGLSMSRTQGEIRVKKVSELIYNANLSLYQLLADPLIKVFEYKLMADYFGDWNQANKIGVRQFIDNKGNEVSLLNTAYSPYPSGVVCLYLPAGAWFVGKMTNKRTNQYTKIPVFQRAKLTAQVGDIIKISPVWGWSTYQFRVTRSGNTGEKLNKEVKLPLFTTIHYWGTIGASYYSLNYNDLSCV